jgi:hypothetical protein
VKEEQNEMLKGLLRKVKPRSSAFQQGKATGEIKYELIR